MPGARGIREEFDVNIAGGEETIFLGELDGAGEVLRDEANAEGRG